VSHLFQKLIGCAIQGSEAQGCQLHKIRSMLLICCCQLGLLLFQLVLQGCLLFALHSQPLAHFLQDSTRLQGMELHKPWVAKTAQLMMHSTAAGNAAELFALLAVVMTPQALFCAVHKLQHAGHKTLCVVLLLQSRLLTFAWQLCSSISSLSVLMHSALGSS